MASEDAIRLAQKAEEASSRLNTDILAEMLNHEAGRQALLEIDPDRTQAIFDGRVSPAEDHHLRIASDANKRIGKENFDSIVTRHRDVVTSIVDRVAQADWLLQKLGTEKAFLRMEERIADAERKAKYPPPRKMTEEEREERREEQRRKPKQLHGVLDAIEKDIGRLPKSGFDESAKDRAQKLIEQLEARVSAESKQDVSLDQAMTLQNGRAKAPNP